MYVVIYFVLAFAATMLGSLTGIGGGVIIRPLLDLIGGFDASTINVLSSATVFVMALCSMGREICQKAKIDYKLALPLAIGSVVGGNCGQYILDRFIGGISEQMVRLVQNSVLAGLIMAGIIYFVNKHKIHTLHLHGVLSAAATGALLGLISSFLGIGGGPFNVALLILVFSLDTKSAMFYSLTIIFFAQLAKLSVITVTNGFKIYGTFPLPQLVAGAVLGGTIGSMLRKELTVKATERIFTAVQVMVFAICIINIACSLK